MKEATRTRSGYTSEQQGDSSCFTAVEQNTKWLLAWHLGWRTAEDCNAFVAKLDRAARGRFPLTTDGFRSYCTAIPRHVADFVDCAQLSKTFGPTSAEPRRYSPPEIVHIAKVPRMGNPDPALFAPVTWSGLT
jgi:hypothetical protein